MAENSDVKSGQTKKPPAPGAKAAPAAAQPEEKQQKSTADILKEMPQKQAYSLAQFNIMIVEDYPFMSELIRGMLREFGVGKLYVSETIEQARDLLNLHNAGPVKRNAVDIVLVDWLMPNGSGADLLHWIRNHKKDSIKFMPTILCSAYASEDLVTKARDAGANEAMVKPVAAEKLAKRLLYVIDHPRPFVKAPGFFGPDRRRKDVRFPGEDRRHMKDDQIKQTHEKEQK